MRQRNSTFKNRAQEDLSFLFSRRKRRAFANNRYKMRADLKELTARLVVFEKESNVLYLKATPRSIGVGWPFRIDDGIIRLRSTLYKAQSLEGGGSSHFVLQVVW